MMVRDTQRRVAALAFVGGSLAWCALALVLSAIRSSLGELQAAAGAALLGLAGGLWVPLGLRTWFVVLSLCAAAVAGNLLRIGFDLLLMDQTSHSLIPLELALSAAVSLLLVPPTTLGIRALRRRREDAANRRKTG